MEISSKIKWQNIYHMITYAIDELAYMQIGKVDVEKCASLDDLFAALLEKSIDLLYKNNFLSDYNKVCKTTDRPRGSILMEKSYNAGAFATGKLCCEYFELSINSKSNQIIKSAINVMLTQGKNTQHSRTAYLRTVSDDLQEVTNIDALDLNFADIDYTSLPEWYKPAIVVSELIVSELLSQDSNGTGNLFRLKDKERLKYIFEKFVRNFYTLEYPAVTTTKPTYSVRNLGARKLDMLLENDSTALIIDTKWYETNSNSHTSNESQIYSYAGIYIEYDLSQKDPEAKKKVCALTLYAEPDNLSSRFHKEWTQELKCHSGIGHFSTKTINVNQDFESIKKALIDIVHNIFEV